MKVNIEKLVKEADSRYSVVIASARRARQINDYFNSVRRHEQIGVPAPQINAISEKPLSIAFQEIAEGRIKYERPQESAE
ncbi:MAG: DNA-directed RNA polymerase subunit omega [Actinobacteria bacterium]|nr:DNA-directed RNA polymerase subunit omega [Actinomycetota bacterium]